MEPRQPQGQETQPVREYRVQPAHNVYAFAAIMCTFVAGLFAMLITCIIAYAFG